MNLFPQGRIAAARYCDFKDKSRSRLQSVPTGEEDQD
jgi:hypothetical protein